MSVGDHISLNNGQMNSVMADIECMVCYLGITEYLIGEGGSRVYGYFVWDTQDESGTITSRRSWSPRLSWALAARVSASTLF